MKVSVRIVSTQRWYDRDTHYFIPVVEVWLNGIRFDHECSTQEEALKIALDAARALGISVDE